MIKLLTYILFSTFMMTSCQKNGAATEKATDKTAAAETHLNVAYGKDTAQKMDIYLPAGRSAATTKALVLIHGGGWNSGNKSDFAFYIDTFKKRLPDYAIFNLNYRLASTSTIFPSQEMDVKAALEMISSKGEQYGVNKNELVLLGFSAGAHLALLQGYKYTTPVKAKAVIDFFGPTDIKVMHDQPWHSMLPFWMSMLLGGTPQTKPDLYRESSPTSYVSPQSPPTLILHGGADQIVPLSQSELLKGKLEKAGVRHELVVYPREGHGWYGSNLSNSFDRIEAFLEALPN